MKSSFSSFLNHLPQGLMIALVLTFASPIKAQTSEKAAGGPSKRFVPAPVIDFIRPTDLGSILASALTDGATSMTRRQGGNDRALLDLVQSAKTMSKKEYGNRMKTLQLGGTAPDKKIDQAAVRVLFGRQVQKMAGAKIKGSSMLIKKVQAGFHFRLGDPVAVASPSFVKYGSVIKAIEPPKYSPALASSRSLKEMGMGAASKAKIIYTIDQLESTPSNSLVFSDKVSRPVEASHSLIPTVWTRAPSTNMDVSIGAADQDAAPMDSLQSYRAPAAYISTSNFDGLVTTRTLSTDVSQSRIVTLNAPIYDTLTLNRVYDHKMKPTSTVVAGKMGKRKNASIKASYDHVKKTFSSEMITEQNSTEYTLTLTPRAQWGTAGHTRLGKVGDTITVGVGRSL